MFGTHQTFLSNPLYQNLPFSWPISNQKSDIIRKVFSLSVSLYHTKLTKYTCDVRHTCQSSNWIEVFCFIIDWSEYHFKPYKTAENYRVRFVYYSRANTLLKLQSLRKLWDKTPINRKLGSLGNSKKILKIEDNQKTTFLDLWYPSFWFAKPCYHSINHYASHELCIRIFVANRRSVMTSLVALKTISLVRKNSRHNL